METAINIDIKCKNCKYFSRDKENNIYGDCSELTFGITEKSTPDILIDNPIDDNSYSTILVYENFGCLKFQII